MISVSHLTRTFPGVIALDNVSFEVEPGEIVGLLGPNGAGKTTAMRILAGFLPASGGQVKVAGHDVFTESILVRGKIGYLPENCPLYGEMRVDEYLHFRASLKGLRGTQKERRVRDAKDQCGLSDAGRRMIGHLSKGFRQRIGLADCLLARPPLIILDEPTIGLDPAQVRQVRELIRGLGGRHTVLLSTHILSEVEMTCDRVLIMSHGRIVASEKTSVLTGLAPGGARVIAEIRGPVDEVRSMLAALPGVKEVSVEPAGELFRYGLELSAPADIREQVFAGCVARGWVVAGLELGKNSLEDIFLSLTRAGGGTRT